jgi:hypothetical protein
VPARPLFGSGGGASNGGAARTAAPSFSSFTAPLPPASGSGALAHSGYEDDTLARMRQAAERRKALEALQREQDREDGQAGGGG